MSRPLSIILDLTARCNLKCVMCHFATVDRLHFHPLDREVSSDHNMPVPVFEALAADLFPKSRRVALACAAEPLIHPRFAEILEIAGRYQVPDLWFPTNLLALTESKMKAILDAGVSVVAVSVDGFDRESYERIRIGGSWKLLENRLNSLRDARRRGRGERPRLRIIFTWMRSNRAQLQMLPEFALRHGAAEIDVRYVCPTDGVDNRAELLSNEDSEELEAELTATARKAVSLGLRLASFPEHDRGSRSMTGWARLRRRFWQIRASVDRLEYRRHRRAERIHGCAYPGQTYVIRPNGAVFPCEYWRGDPIGFYPEGDLESYAREEGLVSIREALKRGQPMGTCATCSERRDAFYRPFNLLGSIRRTPGR